MEWLAIALMAVSLFLIPLGLPGAWIMVGIIAIGAITGAVGLSTLIAVVAIATLGEVIEFFVVKRLTAQYGGSRAAFWGALIGGFIGVIVGVPVPIVGSIFAGFIGSFLGASVVTIFETRKWDHAGRVGWGVLMGRMLSAIVKTFAGIVILVLGAFALIW